MTKYVFNVCVSFSIEISSFFANYGFEPRMSFEPLNEQITKITREKILKNKTIDLTMLMKKVWKFVKTNLQKKFADMNKKSPPDYKEDDFVWLSTKNLQTKRSSKRLNHKSIGPFEIVKIKSEICQLKLSSSMKIHDTFYIFLLRPVTTDLFVNQKQKSSPFVMIKGKKEYDVKNILDFKLIRNKLHYKTKWKRYLSDNRLYLTDNFDNVANLLKKFHDVYSIKSRPPSPKSNYKKPSVKIVEQIFD